MFLHISSTIHVILRGHYFESKTITARSPITSEDQAATCEKILFLYIQTSKHSSRRLNNSSFFRDFYRRMLYSSRTFPISHHIIKTGQNHANLNQL